MMGIDVHSGFVVSVLSVVNVSIAMLGGNHKLPGFTL